jgi:hypothetical protein
VYGSGTAPSSRDDEEVGRSLTTAELARYDHVPRGVAERVRLYTVPLLSPGAHGMTVGRRILLLKGHTDRELLIAHELVHARQYAEQGRVRFLARYLRDYLRNLWRLRRHRAAYLAIPAEEEARSEARAWMDAHA